jgi:hypothetical protein
MEKLDAQKFTQAAKTLKDSRTEQRKLLTTDGTDGTDFFLFIRVICVIRGSCSCFCFVVFASFCEFIHAEGRGEAAAREDRKWRMEDGKPGFADAQKIYAGWEK